MSEQNIRDRLGLAGAARGIKPKWIGFSLEFKVFIEGKMLCQSQLDEYSMQLKKGKDPFLC